MDNNTADDTNNAVDEICESDEDFDDSPESRLLACSKSGDITEMKSLLTTSSVDPNAVSDKEIDCQGLTALHIAVRHKQLKCVKMLLAFGADVNKEDNFGFRPIHDACLHGNSEALTLLLKYGATTDGIKKKGLQYLTPVLYAGRENQFDCLKLLSSKATLDSTLLWDTASKRGNVEILDYLPSKEVPHDLIAKLFQNSALAGNDVFIRTFLKSSKYKPKEEVSRTALFTAAQHGHIKYLAVLLEHGIDPNLKDEKGVTALHNAARFGQLECITELIQSGANIEAVTDQGWTPLHTAVRQCQEEAVALLIELGCNINARGGPKDETALHIATVIGDVPVLQNLLDGNPNLLVRNKSGKSVLQTELRRSVREMIIKHAKS